MCGYVETDVDDHQPRQKRHQSPPPSQDNPFQMVSALYTIVIIALLISTIVLALNADKSSESSTVVQPVQPGQPAQTIIITDPETTTTAAEPVTTTVTVTETKIVEVPVIPTIRPPAGDNYCEGKKPDLPNVQCVIDAVEQTGEQAGANVTKGYNGMKNTTAIPITIPYYEAGLCPVNVHWHLGTEHYSAGEYDEDGKGPSDVNERRRLAGETRLGYQCKHYDANDEKFTKPYEWKHCVDMEIGQTYEVHWPHSAAGACGTVNQYQTPFYDGVFCRDNILTDTAQQIGVQAQIFTIVNDEDYYWPDLMRGMIVDGDFGNDLAMYTGSTTGTSRDNEICSQYAPITWQVDRKCHMVSASTFDKMCADMKAQRDDMSDDLYAHGSRELVADHLAANNHANLRRA